MAMRKTGVRKSSGSSALLLMAALARPVSLCLCWQYMMAPSLGLPRMTWGVLLSMLVLYDWMMGPVMLRTRAMAWDRTDSESNELAWASITTSVVWGLVSILYSTFSQ